jgi:hypothetical protein
MKEHDVNDKMKEHDVKDKMKEHKEKKSDGDKVQK